MFMPIEAQMNIPLPTDIIAKLNEAARLQSRPSSEIIQDAIEDYFNAESWLETEIQHGLEALEAGRKISHDVLKEKYRKLGLDVD
jgi:predicted transcriptional regulator